MGRKWNIISQFLQTKNFKKRSILEEYQKEKLKERLESLTGDFYPKSLELSDYPIINKTIFMENFDLINTCGIKLEEAFSLALKAEKTRDFDSTINGITVGLSSGTSGARGVFLVSKQEAAAWAGYILKRVLPRPYLQKHKVAFFLRANSNLYSSVKSYLVSFCYYDLILPLIEHIENLNKQQPTILIAPAKVLKLLAENKSLRIYPKKVISVAEVLEEQDALLINARFGGVVHQVYQCTEGFLAHTCELGSLHLNEDNVYIEKDWIDKKSGRFAPIITDFFRQSQPLIRYRLDDILVIENKPCACGSVFTRLKKIEGRCDEILDCLLLSGENYKLFPDFIRRAIIGADKNLKEYQVIKKGEVLEVYLSPLNIKNSVDTALAKLFLEHKLCPLKHTFHPFEVAPLDVKRRRVRQV